MNRLSVFLSSILAGAAIAIGGTVFLSVDDRIIGAVAFTVGLFAVCSFGFCLFTGKVCYTFEKDKDYAINLPIIWAGNLVGAYVVALLESFTRIGGGLAERAAQLCDIKLGDDLLSIFILAAFCNVMIYIAVEGYNKIQSDIGKYLALFFGVVVFILCGFEHCVANMYYFSMAGAWSAKAFGYLLIMTLGNSVGGVAIPLLRKAIEKGAS